MKHLAKEGLILNRKENKGAGTIGFKLKIKPHINDQAVKDANNECI